MYFSVVCHLWPASRSHWWVPPRDKTLAHISINDLRGRLDVETGASSTFYHGKVPYYHLNDHLWYGSDETGPRCTGLWEGLALTEVDCGKWRSSTGATRVCPQRTSGAGGRFAGLAALFLLLVTFFFSAPTNIFEPQSSGRELSRSVSAGVGRSSWKMFLSHHAEIHFYKKKKKEEAVFTPFFIFKQQQRF